MFLKYQAKKLNLSFMCFFLCLLVRNAMCTFVIVPPIRVGMRDACMNPDVVFTVFKIVFCVMFIMLGLKFIWVGLLTFGTIPFFPLSICTANSRL